MLPERQGFYLANSRLKSIPQEHSEANRLDWLFYWVMSIDGHWGVRQLAESAPVYLDEVTRKRIFGLLEDGYPNEAGGFLLGQGSFSGQILVKEAIPVTNQFAAAEQHHRYAMSAQDWLRYEDEADALGLQLLGYYHSHPDSPAIPSEYDRVHALPRFVYLITAVHQGKATELRAWCLKQDRSAFSELSLLPANEPMVCS